MERFTILDIFRGAAALFVVVFHGSFVSGFSNLDFFRGAFLFVDYFFVLSGFVITYSIASRAFDIKFAQKFIKKRVYRLWPLHLFLLCVFLSFEVGKYLSESLLSLQFNNAAFSGANAPSEILPNLFLIHAWGEGFDSKSFNSPSWSISIELLLYFFACSLFLLTNSSALRVVVSILILVVAVCFKDLFSTVILRGVMGFFTGLLVYYIFMWIKGRELKKSMMTFLEVFSLFIILIYVSNYDVSSPFYSALIFGGSVLVFAFEAGVVSSLIKVRVLIRLGEISYSIYLVHAAVYFVLIAGVLIFSKLFSLELSIVDQGVRFLDFGSWFLNSFVQIFVLFVTVYISKYTFEYIELRYKK